MEKLIPIEINEIIHLKNGEASRVESHEPRGAVTVATVDGRRFLVKGFAINRAGKPCRRG